MDAAVERVRDLGVDLTAKPGQATERRLDMPGGAAETVIQIEVTKSGVEIVEPHQADDPAAEPDAFGVSGGAIDDLGRFGELVGLVLVGFLGGIGRLGPICRRFAGLFLGVGVAALGDDGSGADQKGKPGDGEVTQNRTLKLKHPSTHRFPDLLPACAWPQPAPAGLMPFKWVSNAAETLPVSHDGHLRFCPANSQLYRVVVKPRRDFGRATLGRVPATG